jgi:hypothetical protein
MTWDEVDARLLQETLRVQDKPYRTRGNPSWVLKMVALVKVKRCRTCGCEHDVELHHEDGNWKNYRLYNLNWYCKQHHQEADNRILHIKEKTMSWGINMKWTVDMKALFKQHIQEYQALGDKSAKIFSEISKNSETIFGKPITARNLQKTAYKFQLMRGNAPSKNTTPSSVKTQRLSEVIFEFGSFSSATEFLETKRLVEAAGHRFMLR